MKRNYLKLQFLRVFKIYPTIFLVTLLMIVAIAVTCAALLFANNSSADKQKISIGVVGDTEDTLLNVGLEAIKNMDSTRFYMDIVTFDEEGAAEKALKNREINGYLRTPKNYFWDVYDGVNNPAEYVILNAPDGFGSILSGEVARVVSDIVTQSQVGVYSAQDVAAQHGKSVRRTSNDLMDTYAKGVLARNELYEVKVLGIADSLSFVGYYICGLLLFFLLLWGVSCNRIFASRSYSLSHLLKNSGISTARQIACEYLPFLCVTVMTLILFAIPVGIVAQFAEINVPELYGCDVFMCIGFVIAIIPVIVMITAMQFAFYEIVSNTVGSVLMQFILAVGLGYISGCFYPNYFFSEIVQKIAYWLPSGIGFSYIKNVMSAEGILLEIGMIIVYTALFAGIAVCVRNRKLTGDRK